MTEPFLSEIKIMSFNFPPKGWALCNGQLLPINQNQALYSLLDTTYGGNGQTNFALPNLQGQVPIHMGSGHTLGEKSGTESVTLSQDTMPQHFHQAYGTANAGTVPTVPDNVLAGSPALIYNPPGNLQPLQPETIGNFGGGQPHENRQPYLVLSFCIALVGIWPSQT
jgi:microcystin-dependent protein